MVRPWTGTSNQFEAATRNSKEKAVLISTFTDSALASAAGVTALYTYYHPLHLDLTTAFDAWRIQVGIQKGKTQELNGLVAGLIVAARDWDLKIQAVYAKGTPEYTTLLPYGRAPFYSGKKDIRIRGINQLSLAIGADPLLATVKTIVDDYYTAILALSNSQQGEISNTDAKSNALEAARIAACKGLEYVLSGLKQHFPDDPSRADEFFRLDLIRNISQKVYTGTITPATVKAILKRKLKPTSIIKIKNTGQVTLEFYMAAIKGGPVPEGTTPQSVPPGLGVNVPVSALGNINNRFLTVRNQSELISGDWEIGL